MPGCYKIKARAAGFRLVYLIVEEEIVILVLSVGERDEGEVYDDARTELAKLRRAL